MKLLFICDEYPPGPHGGIGTAVQLMARTLVRQGHQVWVAGLYDYGYGGADEESDEGVRVFRLRKRSEGLGISMRYTFYDKVMRKLFLWTGRLERETAEGLERLRQFIENLSRTQQVQLAEIADHQHYTRQLRRPVYFPKISIPFVVRLHGGNVYLGSALQRPVAPAAMEIEKDLLTMATAISSVSHFAAEQTLSLLDLDKKVYVLHNGIELPPPAGFDTKDPFKVIFTGSLQAGKGVFQLMKAWNIVHRACPEARLHVYGKGAVKPLQALLNPGAEQSVVFYGHQPRGVILKALETASTGVFPSFAETFALAPMEAMARQVATIYTLRTSGPELIEDGNDGLLIEPSQEAGIAAAILKLLQDTACRQQLATAGYERIRMNFDVARIAGAQIAFYQSLLAEAS